MKNNLLSASLFAGCAVAASIMPVSASAEEADLSSSTIVVDDVKIEIRASKSTIETLKIPVLSEDGMADAFLIGAFEPTAAGEAVVATEVKRGVNDNVLVYTETTEADEENFKRRTNGTQAKEAASSADVNQPKLVFRPDGNVAVNANLSVSAR
jgi:hypothetical protein